MLKNFALEDISEHTRRLILRIYLEGERARIRKALIHLEVIPKVPKAFTLTAHEMHAMYLTLSPEVQAAVREVYEETTGHYFPRDREMDVVKKGVLNAQALIKMVLADEVPAAVGAHEVLQQALRELEGHP